MMRRPQFSKDEFMRRGMELCERIRPQRQTLLPQQLIGAGKKVLVQ